MKFKLTSPFGALEEIRDHPHTGIDIAMPEGTPVRAVEDGVVELIVNYGSQNSGKTVKIDVGGLHSNTDTIYGHLSEFAVQAGDKVEKGDIIGLSGNTGNSTGPHLHFGLNKDDVPVDPSVYADSLQNLHPLNFWEKFMMQGRVNQYDTDKQGIISKFIDDGKVEGHLGRDEGFWSWTHDKVGEHVLQPLGEMMAMGFHNLWEVINANSAGIITLGIVLCGGGLMVGSMIGHSHKWMGRLFIILWGGIIWRALT